MGLASAMNTALTGLSASETQIDVIGNNLANANTIGFKASDVTFATQFLQTQSVGNAASADSGGSNPRQQGLGTMVSEITPNFTQGTISGASSTSDMAIQGDGFFIVQGAGNQQLYTRNGTITTNSENQLVTSTGNRVMGYGVNSDFEIDTSALQPLQIPLGTAMVAKATTTATLTGSLTPDGTVGDTASIIETGVLTDGSKSYPTTGPTAALTTNPDGSLATGNLTGTYTYYVTFGNGNTESIPQKIATTSPLTAANEISLTNIPTDSSGEWTDVRIYRSVNDGSSTNCYQIADLTPAEAALGYTDDATDASIEGNKVLSFAGPPVSSTTLMKDVVEYSNGTYTNVFPTTGSLSFTGTKGGTTLTTQTMNVTDTSTLSDFASFLQGSLGIQPSPGTDASNPIPPDAVTGDLPGVTITSTGQIQIVGNDGTDNAVGVDLSSLDLTPTGSDASKTAAVNLPFNDVQSAAGVSTTADVVVYDSLGMPLSVKITAVLEATTSTYTEYRWYADCGQNDAGGAQADIAVGTGVVKFDGNGNFISSSNDTVAIGRANEPSVKPLEFNLDFSQVSGLSSSTASLAVSEQDGSAPGVLNSFTVGDDGTITGVFSNGLSETMGQIRLARFVNPTGLEQVGENMYATGVNSGLPIEGNPGESGTGTIVAGSLEASNTDVGSSLIDLILASTMYTSNTKIITTAQNCFDQLMQLMR